MAHECAILSIKLFILEDVVQLMSESVRVT